MFEIIFYTKQDNTQPVVDFLESLTPQEKAKIVKKIQILEIYGNLIQAKFLEFLQSGLFQIRVQSKDNYLRIIYFFYINKKIILLLGFKKKTNKTPQSYLQQAEKYKNDYIIHHKEVRKNEKT